MGTSSRSRKTTVRADASELLAAAETSYVDKWLRDETLELASKYNTMLELHPTTTQHRDFQIALVWLSLNLRILIIRNGSFYVVTHTIYYELTITQFLS
jgi:transcriptional antiterminator